MIKYSYHSIAIYIEERMRKYQGLILLNLFITIAYADVKIDSFRSYETDPKKESAGIYAQSATLVDLCLQGNHIAI